MTMREAAAQRSGLFRSEIRQLDPASNVEWRVSGVTNEISRCCHAQQAESEALHLRLFRPSVVAFTDHREELVRGKRQCTHYVDLVDKDHKTAGNTLEHDLL